MTSRVLLLNASLEPLAVVTARRAIVLILNGKAECLELSPNGAAFHSERLTVPTPSVMRLSRYVRVPYRAQVPMTRSGVLRRDRYACVYCARRADTIDHVMPRSRGGRHSWENCVACCKRCNSAKADRSLDELGWTLTVTPRAPRGPHGRRLGGILEVDPAWEPWLAQAA